MTGGEVGVHGGVRFFHGSPKAARCYLEADRSRVDDYYLAEGTGLATRYVATPSGAVVKGGTAGPPPRGVPAVRVAGVLDGPDYEWWVAGYTTTGEAKGRLRKDADGIRFFEVLVNGPKTWSLAAALHPEIATAYDAAQDRAAEQIIGWLAEHSTTRVGPRGRQVQVPVEQLEAAVIRHYTSRAGDPHRHLHLQVNARVFAAGRWRGLHSRGLVDSLGAIHGIGHAAMACDPEFRQVLAAHGYALDTETGEVCELAPFAGAFSARAAQIGRNIDRYEAEWRTEHPGQEPGTRLRRTWDQRAWAQARPDKVVPTDGHELEERWVAELTELGFTPPTRPDHVSAGPAALPVGRLDRDAVVELALSQLGARRSGWNSADIRGQVEKILALAGIVTDPAIRQELAEDLTARTVARCVRLLDRDDVPEHVRSFTSTRVLAVEKDLVARLATRAEQPATRVRVGEIVARRRLDPAQRQVVAALAGTGRLLVIEGAAGAGKTTTLAAAADLLAMGQQRLVVVTPTLKAARVAAVEVGADAFSAAWLVHQHGYRWDADGHWTRQPVERDELDPGARLLPGDVLLCDEAGMLDRDTASALLTVADETGARVAFLGDRHQLPAVGRGGVLDLAARWTPPAAHLELEAVHRFTDPAYAQLSLLMRTGEDPGRVFDALLARGQIVVHATEVERLHALTRQDPNARSNADRPAERGLILADTREQVAALNAAIRDQRLATGGARSGPVVATGRGEQIGVGDRVATRRNDRDLAVANRDTWTVTAVHHDGALDLEGRNGHRRLPVGYVAEHVELAYATTIYGAQGETVQNAHLLIGETTGAAAAYVGMTRGRQLNTAHLVANTPAEARRQWIGVFGRDRADLGPAHAAQLAAEDIATYGPTARRSGRHHLDEPELDRSSKTRRPHRPRRPLEPPEPYRPPSPGGGYGIGL